MSRFAKQQRRLTKKPVSEIAKQKWGYHCLKQIQKVLKKAKEFENRKLSRRLTDCRKGAEATSIVSNAKLSEDKLRSQQEALKNLDLRCLATQVAQKYGIAIHAEAVSPGATPKDEGSKEYTSVEAVLVARLARAACVRKQLDQSLQEYKHRFLSDASGAAEDDPAQGDTGDEGEEEEEDAESMGGSDDEAGRDGALGSAEGLGSSGREDLHTGEGKKSKGLKRKGEAGEHKKQQLPPPPPLPHQQRQKKAVKKRKNHLGQHARRRLAEVKYGYDAKHFQAAIHPRSQQHEEVLHPSWAAKRQQQRQQHNMMAFDRGSHANKKVRYDDNGSWRDDRMRQRGNSVPHTRPSNNRPSIPTNGHQGASVRQKEAEVENLHPSWQAKKAQQLKLTSISHQAAPTKKIVFADD